MVPESSEPAEVKRDFGRAVTWAAFALLLSLVGGWFFFSKQVVRAPDGISDRYVLHVGPTLFAGVEDTATHEIVFWYDMDRGPDLKRIERLPSGEWVVTLAPRSENKEPGLIERTPE
jgi:hypothetical protein